MPRSHNTQSQSLHGCDIILLQGQKTFSQNNEAYTINNALYKCHVPKLSKKNWSAILMFCHLLKKTMYNAGHAGKAIFLSLMSQKTSLLKAKV